MRQIPRLYVATPLAPHAALALDEARSHYLARVLRLETGATVHLFDDQTGEYAAEIVHMAKRGLMLRVTTQLRPRESVPDLWLLTAPIKRERFLWIIEKATELGVARIMPVLTDRTNRERLNMQKLHAHMVEAAEQCERTALPTLAEPQNLGQVIGDWPAERRLFFADEEAGQPMAALNPTTPAAILIGPEGGFSPAERASLLALPATRRLSLGPRILRADTAVVAAIAQFQALSLTEFTLAYKPPPG